MHHKIIPALLSLATPIDKIKPLPGNPHKGDVAAAVAVLREFGQHTPLVGQGTMEDGGICLGGNTRLRAAQQLGWTHMAVAWIEDEDNARAMARALADNKLAQMGADDPVLMSQAMDMAIEDHFEVFEALGIDDFELAAMRENIATERESGYIAPELTERPSPRPDPVIGEPPVVVDSPVVSESSEPKPTKQPVVQYSLVFDNADQQKRWYAFVKWLRADAEVGAHQSTSAKLIAWLEARAPF